MGERMTAQEHIVEQVMSTSGTVARLVIKTPCGLGRLCLAKLEQKENETVDHFASRISDEKKRLTETLSKFIPPVPPRHDVAYALLDALRTWKRYAAEHEGRDITTEESTEGQRYRKSAHLLEATDPWSDYRKLALLPDSKDPRHAVLADLRKKREG